MLYGPTNLGPKAGFFYMLLALAVLALMYFAGALDDAGEERRQAEEYCDMVYRGAWPDYEQTYQEFCIDGKLRPEGS